MVPVRVRGVAIALSATPMRRTPQSLNLEILSS